MIVKKFFLQVTDFLQFDLCQLLFFHLKLAHYNREQSDLQQFLRCAEVLRQISNGPSVVVAAVVLNVNIL